MCSKRQFSKVEAQSSLNFIHDNHKQYRREKRAYYCKDCNAWHLTSETEEEYNDETIVINLKFKKKWKQRMKGLKR